MRAKLAIGIIAQLPSFSFIEEREMTEEEIFNLAKVIYDAKCGECYMGAERVERERAKFPLNLNTRLYQVPQPWIDVALAQAKAVIKVLGL